MKEGNDKQKKQQPVEKMFDNIASSYDRLNHILSFNIDKLWRKHMVKMVAECRPKNMLDVATGTGDLSIMAARKMSDVLITGVDISEGMLELAREKASKRRLDVRMEFVVGDVENLPSAGEEFDVVTVAFGIRNFQNLEASLAEMYRVLNKDGKIFLMEFGKPHGKLFTRLYDYYSKVIMPRVGEMISGNRAAYLYLVNSIRAFANVDVLSLMRTAGFEECEATYLTDGVAVIYKGKKR